MTLLRAIVVMPITLLAFLMATGALLLLTFAKVILGK